MQADATTVNIFPPNSIFETGPGTITPNCTITVKKLYTYPCGMVWNSEHVKIGYVPGTVTGQSWGGYHEESWLFIGFPYPFILVAGKQNSYFIRTGSYPLITPVQTLIKADGITPTGSSPGGKFL